MNSNNNHHDIHELLILLLENDLTDSQRNRLIEWSRTNVKAIDIYHDFLRDYSILSDELSAQIEIEYGESFDTELDQALWDALSEQEVMAQEIEIPKSKPRRVLSRKKVHRRKPVSISKFKLVSMVMSVAAILVVIIFLKLPPEDLYSVEIATIVDQINAQWTSETSLNIDSRLRTNDGELTLKKGVVKLRLDDNVDVLIEGPAVFEIERTGLFLNYGRLYSRVSESGLGFTVKTPSAQFVDLGTEFGIKSDIDGGSELHVFKGKVQVFAGSTGDSKTSQIIEENDAVRYDIGNDQLDTIPIARRTFVNQFDSKTNVIRRGQNYIDLADIVGGGNGFGAGRIDKMIDPATGNLPEGQQGRRNSTNEYHPIPSNPYIDGVFVPNGRTEQIVSSQDHLFRECPVTSGLCCYNISYEQRTLDLKTSLDSPSVIGPSAHCLIMHSNMGITFDLQAIRRLVPSDKIVRFQSKYGLRSGARPEASNADFWIVVDGKIRYQQKQVKSGEVNYLSINLTEKDRFLTLVETDGGDPEVRSMDDLTLTPIDSDWGIFADPILLLE